MKGMGGGMAGAGGGQAPVYAPPAKDSKVLKVHRGYEQTGREKAAKVVVDVDGFTVYNALLTQTSLGGSGVNRFYSIQLLRLKTPYNRYEVFCHDGRIGRAWEDETRHHVASKNHREYEHGTMGEGIADFKKWFLKKTGNEWDRRHAFKGASSSYIFQSIFSLCSV